MLFQRSSQRFESLPATPYYAGLVLGGFATVLLGPILPVIAQQWALTDAQAGSIFTAQFTASIIGAVLSSHYRRHSVALGYVAIAIGLGTLSLYRYIPALIGFWFIGLGIGGAVTATSLIFGTEYPESRGRLLTRTNFFWGVGAVTAPQLVAIAERHGLLRPFIVAVAIAVFLASLRFTPLLKSSTPVRDGNTELPPGKLDARIFTLFSAILFLYVGSETAIAGWIASYAHRFGELSMARSSLVVSAFWLSLVVGRALSPLMLRVFSEFSSLLFSIFAAIAGMLMLLSRHSMNLTLAAVVLAGLGCAPIFPLVTSRLLARVGQSRSTGWIFAICGSGGAVLPWLTGLASEHWGSLRIAFCVPLAALAFILVCVLVENRLPLSPPVSKFIQ
jgi:MFS transporter, FHS family, glucose/mannose:H+ symporter